MKAIVVMAHGSRHEPANAEVRDLARRLAESGVADRVETAFLEAATPALPEAIAALAAAGAGSILVLPLFLNTGNHVRRDIPRLIEAARAAHPEARIVQLDHVGASAIFAETIERIARSAIGAAGPRP